jgi:K+-sensing histidine kinase KdpD
MTDAPTSKATPPVPTARASAILAIAALTSLLIAWIDYATGKDSDIFVFYFLPILAATWFAGRPWGLAIAILSAGDWVLSDMLVNPGYSWWVEAWDMIMRLASFALMAILTSRIQRDLVRQRVLNEDLKTAMSQIKQLTGILPMCSFCRRIRDEKDTWTTLESYLAQHSDAQVSHGLCPRCYKKHYGQADGT